MLSDKKRKDPDSQLRRSRAARIGGQARRKQYGYTPPKIKEPTK